MANPIDLIESKIKEIIESSASLFPWMDEHAISVHRLVEAFQRFINTQDESQTELPTRFNIFMNPAECSRWTAQADWENAIIHTLTDTARELRRKFDRPLSIKLIPSSVMGYSDVVIEPESIDSDPGLTNAVPVKTATPPDRAMGVIRISAGLMLEDEKVFPLTRTVTNIGRRSTNHLVLNDLRVSRTHAQIRYVNDHFIIFDIGSTGGTYINGERIQQHHLRSGDVISLAGAKLIFVVDESSSDTRSGNTTPETKHPSSSGHE